MTETTPNAHTLLDELDARQDEVLGQLDELNEQIEGVLDNWTGSSKEPENEEKAEDDESELGPFLAGPVQPDVQCDG